MYKNTIPFTLIPFILFKKSQYLGIQLTKETQAVNTEKLQNNVEGN